MAGVPPEEFLADIRKALGHGEGPRDPGYMPLKLRRQDQRQRVTTIEARVDVRRPELLSRLAQVAERNGWKVRRTSSAEEAVEYMVTLARERGAGVIVRSDHPVFRRVALDDALRRQGARVTIAASSRRRSPGDVLGEMARAHLGLTGVDYAIAETGSVVLLPRRGVSRLVSLLPPFHVALVEPSQVYESLDDVLALQRLAYLQGRGDMGSYTSIISGPSQTADIEQTIITGVHGPGEVHLVLLG